MSRNGAFAVVREHRWLSADLQAEMLMATKPAELWSLGGGKKLRSCSLEDLSKWSAAPGRVFRVVHLFLLVEPARHTRVMRSRLQTLIGELVDNRGAVIEEVDSGLTTAKAGQRRAMMALANEMIARSCRGAAAAANNRSRRGRPLVEFSREQHKSAKAIWRDTVEHPRWQDAAKALAIIKSPRGDRFTVYRARNLWRARKSRA